MSKNKLYTKSYFSKRLKDAGFDVIKLKIPYQNEDNRKWTIIVNPGRKYSNTWKFNVFVTCYKEKDSKDFSFKFQGQDFKDFILETKSMKLIIKIFEKAIEMSNKQNVFNKESIEQIKKENKDE